MDLYHDGREVENPSGGERGERKKLGGARA